MNDVIRFQRAVPADTACLTAARKKVWASTYRGIYPDSMIDQYDWEFHMAKDRKKLEDPSLHTFLVMDGDKCVGYFSYGPDREGAFCLYSAYLLPAYQRKGLGRAMLAQAAAACRAQGYSIFYNHCNQHNAPARRFYEAMGGVLTWCSDVHENRSEDQCRYDYDLTRGEKLWQAKPR